MNQQEGLGGIVNLMRLSPVHREWTLADIERLIIPPLLLGQIEVATDPVGNVVGFMTWGFVSPEVWQGFKDGTRKIQPHDWNSGPELWLGDFVASSSIVARSLIKRARARLPFAKSAKFKRNKRGLITFKEVRICGSCV